jgi:hypothetical protein
MDDLLSAFLGLDGKYCRATKAEQPDGARIAFALETGADASLRELACRMLPIWCGFSSQALESPWGTRLPAMPSLPWRNSRWWKLCLQLQSCRRREEPPMTSGPGWNDGIGHACMHACKPCFIGMWTYTGHI